MAKNMPTDADYEYIHRGPREHSHRLRRESYRGPIRVVFTICADKGCVNLADATIYQSLHEWLAESCAQHMVGIVVLTVMSNHMHMMLAGLGEDSDLWAAVSLFKQKCGFHGVRLFPGLKLQKDFYDHIIRKDEDVAKHARYIAANPVRGGLVDEWDAYPYTYAIEELRFW